MVTDSEHAVRCFWYGKKGHDAVVRPFISLGGGVQGEIEEDEAENTLMNAPCQNNAIRSWSFTSFLLDDFKIPCHGIPL